MFRSVIFWIHLSCGILTALVVLMMSATGVVLTYERQMLAYVDRDLHAHAPTDAERLPVESILAGLAVTDPDFNPTSITLQAEPNAPLIVAAGRSGSRYIQPYTGEVLEPGAQGLRHFFDTMTGWHRWFNATGDGRGPARAITGASNLAFLFLILSGVYLWLPRVMAWTAFKTRLLFHAEATRGKARDFNWHHVFGIWSAVPLAVVVATAVVFSYGWANDLVYRLAGEETPQRGGSAALVLQTSTAPMPSQSLDTLLARAASYRSGWRRISMQLPDDADRQVSFTLDEGNGGQPQRRHTLILDRHTGEVAAWRPFTTQTAGQRARVWIRYLHTGEALGIVGQTVAGLVSLTSLIMVWTGLALAYRRLISPLIHAFQRRN